MLHQKFLGMVQMSTWILYCQQYQVFEWRKNVSLELSLLDGVTESRKSLSNYLKFIMFSKSLINKINHQKYFCLETRFQLLFSEFWKF